MLQRSQTIYLLLGAALLATFVALGTVWGPTVALVHPALRLATYALAVVAAALALGAVVLYKDRARQRSVIGYAQVVDLLLLLPLLVALFATTPATNPLEGGVGRFLLALVPLVAYVLLRMARRGVDRDIATVRSMDRLR